MMEADRIQKALDNFPNLDFSLDGVGVQMKVLLYDEWLEDFTKKFAAYRAELELPVEEWLIKNAKTTCQIGWNCSSSCDPQEQKVCGFKTKNKKWVSVDEIQPCLTQILHDKTVAEEKNVEYAKLVAGQAQEYAEKIEKLQKELNETNLLCELQASRISGLETFKKQCNGKILIDRKQLSERVLEIDKPSNDYGEVCEQNRQYRILLKELLLVEDSKETIK